MRKGPQLCGVYVILNTVNGKQYIGSTSHIIKRWGEHRSALRQKSHGNRILQNAWNKYGEAAFIFIHVEACAADRREAVEPNS